ncbi:12047_t:CDS:1, partial [Racocetra fulgida]
GKGQPVSLKNITVSILSSNGSEEKSDIDEIPINFIDIKFYMLKN